MVQGYTAICAYLDPDRRLRESGNYSKKGHHTDPQQIFHWIGLSHTCRTAESGVIVEEVYNRTRDGTEPSVNVLYETRMVDEELQTSNTAKYSRSELR